MFEKLNICSKNEYVLYMLIYVLKINIFDPNSSSYNWPTVFFIKIFLFYDDNINQ